MKMRKWLSVLLVLCLLFAFVACGKTEYADEPTDKETEATTQSTESKETEPKETEPEATEPENTNPTDSSQIMPLFYKVTDSRGNVAWLFGSIHVGEEYFYPLPNYVTSAYENADVLAVEYDIIAYESDMQAQTADMMQFVYTDGTTIRDHISEDIYNEAVAILRENNMYSMMMDYYCASLWSNLIDNLLYEKINVKSELGIDRHWLNMAYEDSKEIQDIESPSFQTGMLAGFSEGLQEILLAGSIASYEDPDAAKVELDGLLQLWASGDETAFAAYFDAEETFESTEEEQLYQEYNYAMSTSRNLNMADFVEDALGSGKEVFVCVGAAHVVGEGAMVQLLRQRGYTVELVGA